MPRHKYSPSKFDRMVRLRNLAVGLAGVRPWWPLPQGPSRG